MKQGEVVMLGRHHLLCGDAFSLLRDVEAQSVDAVITDPPYCAGAVSESQRTSAAGQGLRSETLTRFGWFIGDNMGTSGLVWLLRSLAVEARRVVKPTGSLLVFCDWRMQSSLQPAIESAGLRYQNLIVWDKGQLGLGAGFRAQHELILHFTFGHPNYHDRATSNVIRCKRVPRNEREHQTQKPVELMERVMAVVAPVGGTVLDPFAGSGSTLIGAENTGRTTMCSEQDPTYCQTIIDRYEQMTQQPKLLEVS